MGAAVKYHRSRFWHHFWGVWAMTTLVFGLAYGSAFNICIGAWLLYFELSDPPRPKP